MNKKKNMQKMNKKILITLLAIICLASTVFAAGSGHKVVYGAVSDQNSEPVAAEEVKVYVLLESFNVICFTKAVSTADDGTYSVDLYTLENEEGFDCKNYWEESDKIWAFAVNEDVYSAESEIDCFGDPNCPGAQELNAITIETTIVPSAGGSSGGGGGGGGSSSKDKEETAEPNPISPMPSPMMVPTLKQRETDVDITDFDYVYDAEKDEIAFIIVIRNNKEYLARSVFNRIVISSLSGQELLQSDTEKVDLRGLKTKELFLKIDASQLDSGTYTADALLFRQSTRDELLDASTSLQIQVLKQDEAIVAEEAKEPEERQPLFDDLSLMQLILLVQIAILAMALVIFISLFLRTPVKGKKR